MSGSRTTIDDLLLHAGWLRGLALQLAADAHGAEDAVQDTLLQAMRHPPDDPARAKGFLATTLRNVLAGRSRAERRRARHEWHAGEHCEAASPSAAELVERAELHQALGRLVLELPEPQREIVLRRHQHGEDVAAVGAATGLSPDAVRAHLRRARATLRKQLERQDPDLARTFAGVTASVGALLRELPEFPGATTGTAVPTATLTTLGLMNAKLWTALAVTAAVALAWVAWPRAEDSQRSPVVPASGPDARFAAGTSDPKHDVGLRTATGEPAIPERGVVVAELATDFVREGRLVGVVPAAPIDAPLEIRFDGRVDGVRREHEARIPVQPDGRFRLVLPPWANDCERFDLRIDFHGLWYSDLTKRFEGELQRDASELLLEVQPIGIVTGRVVDGDGEPVVAARIVAMDPREAEDPGEMTTLFGQTNSGSEGAFLLKVRCEGPTILLALPMQEASLSGLRLQMMRPVNEQELVADAPVTDCNAHRDDLLPAYREAEIVFGRQTDLAPIALDVPSPITGRVVDPKGDGIPGLGVWWLPQDARRYAYVAGRNLALWDDDRAGWAWRGLCGDDGRFGLWANPGRPGVCRPSKIDGGNLPWLTPVPAIAPTHVELRLERRVTIRLLRDGAPVADVRLKPHRTGGFEPIPLVTDESGELQLWLPTEGEARLLLSRGPGDKLWIDAREADDDGLLVIDLDD